MTPENYLGRVRSLLPALRERAAAAEKLRRLPDETFGDFQEAGLFRALQPRRYGGYELDPATFYQAVMEVGAICGSSAWILGVIGVHNWHLAIFPPQAQEEVWGEDTSVQLSTSLAPTGTVQRVDGGFRLSGRWSFSSGCDFCQWAVLGGIVPPVEEGQPPDARVFLVPRSDYAIDDNWHVMGLCATGSKDIVVDDAFVPEYRTHSYQDAFHLLHPGTAINDAPLYRLPFGLVFANGITAPAIGAALGALEAFREQSLKRINLRDQSRVAEDPFTQYRLAEAAAAIGAARDRVLGNFAEMNAPRPRRRSNSADGARPLQMGRWESHRLERQGGRLAVRGERRPRHFSRKPHPARVARCACDAGACRQQSRTRRLRVCPLRIRTTGAGYPVLETGKRQ
jgi:3-hydroxy-9,10-secoandrosta-1,3,5(10)-triene-9,17-dione monooxygenase